jgi:hypothetical protein
MGELLLRFRDEAGERARSLGNLLRWLRRPMLLVGGLAGGLAWVISWRKALAALVGLLLPGTWDLLLGRAMLGAVVHYVFVVAYALRKAVTTGGIFGIAEVTVSSDYFREISSAIAYPNLAWLAQVATGVFWVIYLANIPWVILHAKKIGMFQRAPA